MTQIMHCYENALAERVNGILKQEYEMDRTFRTKEQARSGVSTKRCGSTTIGGHTLMLDYRFPADVHVEAA